MVKKEKINWDKRYREDRGGLDDMSIYTKNPVKKEKIIELEGIGWRQLEKGGQVLKVPIEEVFSKILPELRKENRKHFGKYEDIFAKMSITHFLDYLEEKYVKPKKK